MKKDEMENWLKEKINKLSLILNLSKLEKKVKWAHVKYLID